MKLVRLQCADNVLESKNNILKIIKIDFSHL